MAVTVRVAPIALFSLLVGLTAIISIVAPPLGVHAWNERPFPRIPTPIEKPCPANWVLRPSDDRCYRLFPSDKWNNSIKVFVNFEEATRHCATFDAEIPLVSNGTLASWLLGFIGAKSGRAIWLGLRHDPQYLSTRPPRFITANRRPYTQYFEWDTKRGMPDGEECLALHSKGNPATRTNGGNGKMITTNCYNQLSVVCSKERYPVDVRAVNRTSNGVIQAVWRQRLDLEIIGQRLPQGIQVMLQTTTESGEYNVAPNQPTNCSVRPHDFSNVYPLKVENYTMKSPLCNGTCHVGRIVVPATAPITRGARYSFCFYNPAPLFKGPLQPVEFSWNAVPNVVLEFVQRREEYLQDLCTRHKHDVDLLFGDRRKDDNRDKVSPFYFDSSVQYGSLT